MSNFPKNFPFGKNMWIWQIWDCVGKKSYKDVTVEDIQGLIQKLKDNDIQVALVKSGDGGNTWEQWNTTLIDAFHAAGIKIFSWTFNYGLNPEREAAVAMWSLDQGGDGHIFDAEDGWDKLPNPGQAATTLLQLVRQHAPTALLGHSPEPIIDYHQHFPYVEFGKYCDFVLPQIYFGEWGKTPIEGVDWMFDNWSRWEKTWTENGFGDSVKPIIPVCQCYDDYSVEPNFIVTPSMIHEFVQYVAGYKAVSFYEYAHILRLDCWDAIKTTKVTPPTDDDLGRTVSPTQPHTPPSAAPTVPPVPEANLQGQEPTVQPSVVPSDTPSNPVIPQENPDNGVLPQKVDLSKSGHTTITVKKNEALPSGLEIKITHHTPHALLVKTFFTQLFSLFVNFFRSLKRSGGEQK